MEIGTKIRLVVEVCDFLLIGVFPILTLSATSQYAGGIS